MVRTQTLYEPSTEHDSCGFGFVADIAGRPSHAIVRDALTVLANLEHRGASGSEKNTGDGAGILVTLPYRFLGGVAATHGVTLPRDGYGVGMVFLPRDAASREACRTKVVDTLQAEGLTLLGWRPVPTDPEGLGDAARSSQPVIEQAFVARPDGLGAGPDEDLDFDRRLYIARRLIEKAVSRSALPGRDDFYIASMSCRTDRLQGDAQRAPAADVLPGPPRRTLRGPARPRPQPVLDQHLPVVGSGAPVPLHQPQRRDQHAARKRELDLRPRSRRSGPRCSGTTSRRSCRRSTWTGPTPQIFDNVLELLHLSGRSLAHVMMMMVPEPWGRNTAMSAERRAFYEYHSCLMEPWDGPASLAFTDGIRIGATLDRNGLRPGRYWVTRDGRVVMASEAGVLDIPPGDVIEKGRLQPGRMFLVDTAQGRIIPDEELKAEITGAEPYEEWVRDALVRLEDLPAADVRDRARPRDGPPAPGGVRLHRRGRADDRHADGDDGHGPGRLDGQRRAARRPVREAAAPVQLLQAAVRAGHQPAGRRDPRRDHHGHGPLDRAGGEPPRAGAGRRPPGRDPLARHLELRAGADPGARRRPGVARIPHDHAADPVQGLGQRRGPPARDRGPPARGIRGDQRGLQPDHPVGPRPQRDRRADPGAARRELGPPPPRAGGHAWPDRPRARVRRAARGAPLLPAHRLRRVGDQPVPRVRDDRRPGPPRARSRARTRQAEYRYRKAATKGVIKAISRMGISTVHSYHGAQVFEAIGLNQRLRRRVLHLDADPHRRHRDRDRVQGGQGPPGSRLAAAPADRPQAAAARRAIPVPRGRREPPVQPAHDPHPPARGPQRRLRARSRTTARSSTTRARGSRRCAACWSSRRRRAPSRSRRWSRSRRSSGASRPAR